MKRRDIDQRLLIAGVTGGMGSDKQLAVLWVATAKISKPLSRTYDAAPSRNSSLLNCSSGIQVLEALLAGASPDGDPTPATAGQQFFGARR